MQKPALGLRAVADNWISELKPAAQQLWKDLVAERQAADPRFGGTRAMLTFSRLSVNSWNQYTTALRSFCTFCASLEPPVTLDKVKPAHLTDYVCWLTERDDPLKHGTVASYLAGIRSVLTECGRQLPPDAEIKAVLDGYKRWRAQVQDPEVKRPAWPARFTVRAISLAQQLLDTTQNGFPTQTDHAHIVSTAYICLASICFSRGDTVAPMQLKHIVVTNEGALMTKLEKQKRPQDHIPDQVHHPTEGDASCPVRFILEWYLPYLSTLRYEPQSNLFGLTAQARTKPLDNAVKMIAVRLGIHQQGDKPWTGHCVRIGAVSEASAVGVPLAKIAHFACHRSTNTTEGYVRHGVVADSAAQTFYARLAPQTRSVSALPL